MKFYSPHWSNLIYICLKGELTFAIERNEKICWRTWILQKGSNKTNENVIMNKWGPEFYQFQQIQFYSETCRSWGSGLHVPSKATKIKGLGFGARELFGFSYPLERKEEFAGLNMWKQIGVRVRLSISPTGAALTKCHWGKGTTAMTRAFLEPCWLFATEGNSCS